MDQFLVSAEPFVVIAVLWVGLTVLHYVRQITERIDAIEIDRTWFTKRRDEQIESLQCEVSDLKGILSDLVDFQKGDGRYRYDPNDPRLPAHIRDQTGRDD
jgi:hypothetical protein